LACFWENDPDRAKIMTKKRVYQQLKTLEPFGIKPGLGRVRGLLARMGNPQQGLQVIHVAGTNGKGSVCALLDSVLRAAGYRVGLYTSPHLVDLSERFVFQGRPIQGRDLEASFARTWPAVRAAMAAGEPPTFFEATTAMALDFFAAKRAQVVVLEVGLGGRYDATNLFDSPLLTLITNIDLEHTQVLGKTVERIAWEKAGIVKPGVDLVTAASPKALAVIRREWQAAQRRAPVWTPRARLRSLSAGHGYRLRASSLIWAPQPGQRLDLAVLGKRRRLFLPLLGPHQAANLACVLAGVESLRRRGLRISEAALKRGIGATRWPGRLQLVSRLPRLLLDGAHNPAGARALAAALPQLKQGRLGLVMGVFKDKDWPNVLGPLLPQAERCFFSAARSARALKPGALLRFATQAGCPASAHASLAQALAAARAWARPEDTLVVAGSLYSVGELLAEKRGRA
jgi:dihydrofolate synthase/folylpolyglutamate synthase